MFVSRAGGLFAARLFVSLPPFPGKAERCSYLSGSKLFLFLIRKWDQAFF
jgi:hypothetical protein